MADKKEVIIEDSENVKEDTKAVGNTGESNFLETGIYTYKFKTPYTWEDKTYTEMTFNFGELKGEDLKAVEREMSWDGQIAYSPLYSDTYLLNLAARAAGVHSSVMDNMPLRAALTIREHTKRFFMRED